MFNKKCREKMCHVVYLIIKSNCLLQKLKGSNLKKLSIYKTLFQPVLQEMLYFGLFILLYFITHHHSKTLLGLLLLLSTLPTHHNKKWIPFTIARASSCCSSESFFFLLLYSFYSSSCVAEECWREITVNKHRLTAAQCCEPGRVWCLISVMFSL